jgi:glycosyltransferase involved in cell wall biosynthesis
MEEEQGGGEPRMTKLLSLVWYKVLPPRFGGQKGIAEFNRYLAAHFPLTCLCSSNNIPVGDEPYDICPDLPVGRSQVLNPNAWRKVVDTASQGRFTHLILEHAYYGLPAVWLRRRKGIFLIAHAHNIEFQRFRELGKWWWPALRMLEAAVQRRADLNLYKTDSDRQEAIRSFSLDPSRCMVVPYGLTRERVPEPRERSEARARIGRSLGIPAGEKILYFNGTLDYGPNADALRTLVKDILPALASTLGQPFRLVVTGRNIKPGFGDLDELRHDHYLNAGLLDDVSDLYLGADVFLSPVTRGGGIKVKVMEALSWGLPVVCTPHAAEGIDTATTGTRLHIVAGDTDAFCREVAAALGAPGQLPDAFFSTYHWSRVIQPVAERIAALQ